MVVAHSWYWEVCPFSFPDVLCYQIRGKHVFPNAVISQRYKLQLYHTEKGMQSAPFSISTECLDLSCKTWQYSLKQATSLYREGIMSFFGLFNLSFALKVFLLVRFLIRYNSVFCSCSPWQKSLN